MREQTKLPTEPKVKKPKADSPKMLDLSSAEAVKLEVVKESPKCFGTYERAVCESDDFCPEHFKDCSGGSQ
jgi:hypothetical protein